MEPYTTLKPNNIALTYSLGAYGKFIKLILHEAYNGEYFKVKDYPEEIVFPASDELGYRVFSNESVKEALPLSWFGNHNWNSTLYKYNYCILYDTPMDQLAGTYRLMQTRYQDMNYEYQCKKFEHLHIIPDKDIFYFYKRNPLYLFIAWYVFVAMNIEQGGYTNEMNTVNYVIDNYKSILNFYKEHGTQHTIDYYLSNSNTTHWTPIHLNSIRTVEGFEETFNIKMHTDYKIRWNYIQKYGQIIEQTFLDYHA